jgi:hypothetical protein
VSIANWSPNARSTLDSFGFKTEVGTNINKYLLEPANVADNVYWVWKLHYWVANQLTWTVPGYFSATVNVNDLSTIVWSLGIFGALAGCVNTLVLKQDAGVWPNASCYFFMDGSLEG